MPWMVQSDTFLARRHNTSQTSVMLAILNEMNNTGHGYSRLLCSWLDEYIVVQVKELSTIIRVEHHPTEFDLICCVSPARATNLSCSVSCKTLPLRYCLHYWRNCLPSRTRNCYRIQRVLETLCRKILCSNFSSFYGP